MYGRSLPSSFIFSQPGSGTFVEVSTMSTVWNFTIEDTSSFITYLPHGDGGSGDWTSTGWQPWFSDAGGFNSAPAQPSAGSSLHITGYKYTAFGFNFYGSNVALYGSANCSYQVLVDDIGAAFSGANDGEIYSVRDLPDALHQVTVVAHATNDSMFAFDRAVVGREFTDGPPVVYQMAATDTSVIQYEGAWDEYYSPKSQIPSKEHPAPFYRVLEPPASFSVAFRGSGVSITGARNYGSGTYLVTLDDVTTAYNESTMWLIGDALLFYQEGLDPQMVHNLTVIPDVGRGTEFRLNTVNVYAPHGVLPFAGIASGNVQQKHKSKTGVIVGSVVGAVAALVIASALVFWVMRRQQRRKPPQDIPAPNPSVFNRRRTTWVELKDTK